MTSFVTTAVAVNVFYVQNEQKENEVDYVVEMYPNYMFLSILTQPQAVKVRKPDGNKLIKGSPNVTGDKIKTSCKTKAVDSLNEKASKGSKRLSENTNGPS